MDKTQQGGGNIPTPTITNQPAKSGADIAPFKPPTLIDRFIRWSGGLVNNPTTGQISHSKLWANVAAAVMTYKFIQAENIEWLWWAYGGGVGGYGLLKRLIAGGQQIQEAKQEVKNAKSNEE